MDVPCDLEKKYKHMKNKISFILFFLLANSQIFAIQKYDVVVYGGTPSGVIASVAAAREGLKVLLIEQTKHVGGLNSSGLGTADYEGMVKGTISGLPLELYKRIGVIYGKTTPMYHFEPGVFEKACNDMLKEAKTTILYERFVVEVKKNGTTIVEIRLDKGESIRAKVFIDASYEGDLMARAGVKYTFGRESKDKYGESLAGVRIYGQPIDASPYDDNGKLLPGFVEKDSLIEGMADKRVQNYNFRLLISTNPDRRPFPKPDNYNPNKYILLSRVLKSKPDSKFRDFVDINSWEYPAGKSELNNTYRSILSMGHVGGNVEYPDADYDKRKIIFQDHKDWTLGFLYFLANDPSSPEKLKADVNLYGLASDEFKDNQNFPYYLYIREARRMIGEYVHTQNDVLNAQPKDDAIAIGAHYMDSHQVQRVAYSKTQIIMEGKITERFKIPYEISYRSLVPKSEECTNLIVPGCVSASHVGFCSIRVEPTWMTLGESAGVAAALALKNKCAVQNVEISTLQKKLTNYKSIISVQTWQTLTGQ